MANENSYEPYKIRRILTHLLKPYGLRAPDDTKGGIEDLPYYYANEHIIAFPPVSDWNASQELETIEVILEKSELQPREIRGRKLVFPLAEEQTILGKSRRHWVTLVYDPDAQKATLIESRPRTWASLYYWYYKKSLEETLKSSLRLLGYDLFSLEVHYQEVQHDDIYCGVWTGANIQGLASGRPIDQQRTALTPWDKESLIETFTGIVSPPIPHSSMEEDALPSWAEDEEDRASLSSRSFTPDTTTTEGDTEGTEENNLGASHTEIMQEEPLYLSGFFASPKQTNDSMDAEQKNTQPLSTRISQDFKSVATEETSPLAQALEETPPITDETFAPGESLVEDVQPMVRSLLTEIISSAIEVINNNSSFDLNSENKAFDAFDISHTSEPGFAESKSIEPQEFEAHRMAHEAQTIDASILEISHFAEDAQSIILPLPGEIISSVISNDEKQSSKSDSEESDRIILPLAFNRLDINNTAEPKSSESKAPEGALPLPPFALEATATKAEAPGNSSKPCSHDPTTRITDERLQQFSDWFRRTFEHSNSTGILRMMEQIEEIVNSNSSTKLTEINRCMQTESINRLQGFHGFRNRFWSESHFIFRGRSDQARKMYNEFARGFTFETMESMDEFENRYSEAQTWNERPIW